MTLLRSNSGFKNKNGEKGVFYAKIFAYVKNYLYLCAQINYNANYGLSGTGTNEAKI